MGKNRTSVDSFFLVVGLFDSFFWVEGEAVLVKSRQSMGIRISAPTLYETPRAVKHKANSAAGWIFEILALLTVLIVPFIVCFYAGQMWMKNSLIVEIPKLSYTGKCVLSAETLSGKKMLWASSKAMEDLLAGDDRLVQPFFSIYEDDHDGDEKADEIFMRIMLPLDPGDAMVSLRFLPAFRYNIHSGEGYFDVDMETAVLLGFETAPPVHKGAATIDGFINFYQMNPLYSAVHVRYDRLYNRSHFDAVRDVSGIADVGALASAYQMRNESVSFVEKVIRFGDEEDATDVGLFRVDLRLRVSPATIQFTPNWSQVLKFAWVQYFCVAYVIGWFVGGIRYFVVYQGLFNTISFLPKLPR